MTIMAWMRVRCDPLRMNQGTTAPTTTQKTLTIETAATSAPIVRAMRNYVKCRIRSLSYGDFGRVVGLLNPSANSGNAAARKLLRPHRRAERTRGKHVPSVCGMCRSNHRFFLFFTFRPLCSSGLNDNTIIIITVISETVGSGLRHPCAPPTQTCDRSDKYAVPLARCNKLRQVRSRVYFHSSYMI